MYTVIDVELRETGRIGRGQFGMTISTGFTFVAPGSEQWKRILADANIIKSLFVNADVHLSPSFSEIIVIANR
jgi:hypothetical protein